MNVSLNWADIAIIAAYFLVILLIGMRLRGNAQTSSEYFQAGRSLPPLITGIAFVAANSGALEILGVVSTTAKYGMRAVQFYWLGAIPAMLFLAIFMMPVYYGSRARSVPEFLNLRFGEATRALNAGCFAVMMVLVSGISLYAMAIVLKAFLGWQFLTSTLIAGGVVLIYIVLGGLKATIYNEVLQFALIVAGLSPLAYFILRDFHGLGALRARLSPDMSHAWLNLPLSSPYAHPMDVAGIVFGLGFVLSFGYWCTDFLLVQRALAARDVQAASLTPIIGGYAKLFTPALVVIPGLAAALLFPALLRGHYDLALPLLMQKYYGHGLLGVGVVAMLASFMSGTAGNVTAFNTVWTYDLYQAYIAPGRSDRHYLFVGRLATIAAVLCSVATAFIVLRFSSLLDYVQLLFSFFNAPLLATILFGMFTRWATPSGGFWGLLAGTAAAVLHRLAFSSGRLPYGSDMNANFYGAIVAFLSCAAVTAVVSRFTQRRSFDAASDVLYRKGSALGRRNVGTVPLVSAGVLVVLCLWLNWWLR